MADLRARRGPILSAIRITRGPRPWLDRRLLLRRFAGFGRSSCHTGALAILAALLVPFHLGHLAVGLVGRRRGLLREGCRSQCKQRNRGRDGELLHIRSPCWGAF